MQGFMEARIRQAEMNAGTPNEREWEWADIWYILQGLLRIGNCCVGGQETLVGGEWREHRGYCRAEGGCMI